ncbi:Ribosomal biogenesis GTPase [Alteracholeplasma palmae J233]|uniref:Ribosome biogenesis GTPase A n=1 Tax=Alteracholeplasma palmae (strain ATCC 49389 / J233) TaxID=1318466 RepID=U4KKF8_ALTPJ|nr:ribosome biogenesis GTPase YlqF [Alteracholeplasma palmae]CCV64048.1 Ribosomal biogenesis GTPase [Alteracholeplasma palmae J233]
MKQIQWFPGHMFKSLREMKEKLKLMDIVFILLDARIPYSSMNPNVLEIVGMKPTLILFNKTDLADPNKNKAWIKYYQEQGFYTLDIDAQSGKNVNKIYDKASEILKEKIEREEKRGLKRRPIRAMIIGIPNVGKSTLINQMTKSKATKTGNTPGVTKAQQWIKVNEQFELLDTPGVLWPKFDSLDVGFALAITGAIKDKILPTDDIVKYAIDYLKKYYPNRLKERYGIDALNLDYVEMLDQIGIKRGAILKANEIDYDRVYTLILTDIRSKNLGGITFDTYNKLISL